MLFLHQHAIPGVHADEDEDEEDVPGYLQLGQSVNCLECWLNYIVQKKRNSFTSKISFPMLSFKYFDNVVLSICITGSILLFICLISSISLLPRRHLKIKGAAIHFQAETPT